MTVMPRYRQRDNNSQRLVVIKIRWYRAIAPFVFGQGAFFMLKEKENGKRIRKDI